MREVRETKLPGVGVRYEFLTADGARVGVVAHRTGRRELLLYDSRDPDASRSILVLDADDARTLSELLGASQVTEHLAAMQNLAGLAIDWLRIGTSSPLVQTSIRDAQIRTRTGVSVVAIVRDEETLPAPTPDVVLAAGDTLVVVGTPDGIRQLIDLAGP